MFVYAGSAKYNKGPLTEFGGVQATITPRVKNRKRRKLEKKIDKLQGDVVVQVFDRVIWKCKCQHIMHIGGA